MDKARQFGDQEPLRDKRFLGVVGHGAEACRESRGEVTPRFYPPELTGAAGAPATEAAR